MSELKAACDLALKDPDFQPDKGVTHCNQAVMFVARNMGCYELNGYNADEQYQIMSTNASGHWQKVGGPDASIHALSDKLAIAALPSQALGETHGHVAACYPLGMQYSGSLKHDVPMVANVGKTVGVMKSSSAFPVADGEAEYFIYS